MVSGASRGPLAALARGGLCVASGFYRVGQAAHAGLYRSGLKRAEAAPIPVVSVGNLTVGGTGKTPLVEAICRHLQGRGLRVAVLSRGYGAPAPGEDNDEVALLRENLGPQVAQVVGRDRIAGARRAFEGGASVAVLDDGFQHRRLKRDVDVVVLDALRPFGFDRVLPRGMLREPAVSVARADAIVVSRAEVAPEGRLEEIRRRLTELGFDGPIATVAMRPSAVHEVGGGGALGPPQDPESLAGKTLGAMAGVGNPDGFRATLVQLGARVAYFRAFADHHDYCGEDLQQTLAAAARAGASAVVTTQKDGVKLRKIVAGLEAAAIPLLELHIRADLGESGTGLFALIDERVDRAREGGDR